MGVIRVERSKGYTVMSNYHLRDKRLSLRAMGLMSKLLSDSETFTHSVAGLAGGCKEGREAVRTALRELETLGYLVREQTREGGTFGHCDYTLYETPREIVSDSGATPTEDGSKKSPLPKNPTTGNPTTGNPTTEIRINKSNNNQDNNPPIAPQGAGAPEKAPRKKREAKKAPDWEPEIFARFWAAYPCGKDKQSAIEEWDKLRPDRALMQLMSAALDRDKASAEWRRGIGIPYACRWLRRRRWEDEERAPVAPPDSGGGYWSDDPEEDW